MAPHSHDHLKHLTAQWIKSQFSLNDLTELLTHGSIAVQGAHTSKPWLRLEGSECELGVRHGLSEVQHAFRAGCSVHIKDLHRAPVKASRLAHAVSQSLGTPVHLDAHLETRTTSRSCCHPWSTLLLQTHGERVLRIAGQRRFLEGAEGLSARAPSHTDVTLRAGDVVYLPSHLSVETISLDKVSLNVVCHVMEQHFTWAAVASLVCRRIFIDSHEWSELDGRPVVGADGLDEHFHAEATRIAALAGSAVRAPRTHEDDPLCTSLPVVLQRAVSGDDLPRGWTHKVLQDLTTVLKELHEVGHLDRLTDMTVPMDSERCFVARGVSVRSLVTNAISAKQPQLLKALSWALAELRLRGVEVIVNHDHDETFTSIAKAKALLVDQMSDLMFARPPTRECSLWLSSDASGELFIGSIRHRVPVHLMGHIRWCLGYWTGACGEAFRLQQMPGDPLAARSAVDLLLTLGALRVVD